nr:vacuolar protein sorting-associated protein 13 isoform X3 [Maniola hyperantus]
MVFESIVVDVLNRFLGNYVENLNRSQLKLGIWGGDVVLENLILKQNALEELNIPVQTVYGHLGKLVLKIPWKNLYGASVEATIERLFLIVSPTAEVKYDPEKEEKMALAAKQAELARVEEAKKKEAEKDDKLDETFVEKLVTQIIKNVQLKISDIHVRYEDSITNPKAPFSFGMTLHNLSVHTTDENWKQTVIQEAVTKIFKILSLEGLAIYLNPATELYSKNDVEQIKTRLQGEIATKSSKPSSYKYALGPISATAKLKLNPKPEGDFPKFSIPKVILTLHMEQLSVSLTKSQYQDMMLLADSMDRMSKGAPYRKYRPNLNIYKGHYKAWWHFAFKCILEEEVKRRRRNWDWNHMLAHRQLCKDYASAYQSKLSNKGKVSAENKCVLDKAEKTLDLFNLVVIRQKIEMEVERLGKLEEEAKKSRGWFGGWWSGGSSKDDELSEGVAIIKQFEKAMTPDEKEKLFRAIDYQENTAPLHLPTEYVAVEGYFRLDKLQVSVNDVVEVLRASVENVEVDMKQRPSANALRVDVQMRAFTVTGKCQGDFEPQLVTSKEVSKDVNLLNVLFETNPLDGACDQRVKVQARPLQIVYDAQTVIEIVNVFKPPTESTALTTLQAVAENKLSDLKEKSTLGMQYAVHHHSFIELDVVIAASFIIIPQTGMYKGEEACAVVKLGAISVKSAPRAEPLDVNALHRQGLSEQDILQEIAKHSYDRMALRLTEMQVVIASPKEDWHSAIASNEATPLHLLQPTNLLIQIDKCLITDDPRLPKIKIMGELQKIAVSVSEDRLLTLCEILVSMPLPHSEEATQLKPSDSKASSLSLLRYLDPVEKQRRDTARSNQRKGSEHTVQLTEVEAFFIMKELIVSVNRKTVHATQDYDKFLVFSLNLLEITSTVKTFTLEANVRLGSVDMQHHRAGQKIISMIETPELTTDVDATDNPVLTTASVNQYLFTVTYSNVDKKCPEFRSHYGSVEQMIELDFTRLKLLLHLEGLREILVVVNEYQTRLQSIQSTVDRYANAGPLETIAEDEEYSVAKSKASVAKPSRRKQVESIQLKINVKIGAVEIEFATDVRPLSIVKLQGAGAGLILKTSYTQVDCTIASIKVEDLNPETVHKEILKVLGGDVINVQIVLYNLDQYPTVSDVNMSIDAQINCLRIVFLNWFVSSMLEFLNNFQTAQAAIIEASSQAADAARANVQNAYQTSTKLSLRVRLAAPIIIVPENSSSLTAMLLDLGRMNLSNKFVDVPAIDVDNKVTVDELTLELEDMKVSCVMLTDENDFQGAVHERKLLRPTSFKLFVKRSLSSWYESLPDLDISGRMKTIAITVGHSDYKSIMKILNQNLQEGQKKTEEAKSQAGVSKATSKVTMKSQTSRIQTKSAATVVTPSKEQSKMPRTTIKFAFTMDSFVIDLMNTSDSDDSVLVKDVDLARFCLALLSVKGRMFSDGSIHTSVLLVDCTLDDTRPGRGAKITRYLERRRDKQEVKRTVSNEAVENVLETPEKIRSMIDITYTMKNGDTFVDMRIFSFNLILAMDFLNKIAEFMTTGLSDATPDSEPKEDVKAVKLQAERSSDSVTKKKVSVVSAPSVAEPKLAMMTVNIKIEQPDIILVESLEQKECDALVLNMEMRLKLRKTEERMVADGAVSGLQVTVRRLGAQISAAPRFLLAPAHLSLALSQPPGQGMHLDIALTDIKITVSPEIIALLNRVLATVTSSEEDCVEQENKPIFYDRLWDIKTFKPTSYWYLKTEEAVEALDLEETPSQEVVKPPVGEICLMSSPSIVLALEMEIGNETIPVLVMQASLTGQVKDWSSDLFMESTWAMQVSYYNIGRAMWEPLIEPVEVLKDSQYIHVPWELKMEVVMRPQENQLSIDTSDDANNLQAVAQRQASKSITVSSSETLEITITRSGMEVLTQLGNFFSAAVGDTDTSVLSKSKIEDSKPEKDSSTPNKNVDETGNVIFHPKDYKEPILFSFRAKNFFGKKKAAIRVEFGEWSDKFSLDVPGSSGVVTCKNEGRTYQVAVTNQLTFNSLTKMVIFTPFFLIINECPFPIQYQEFNRSADPWQEVQQNSSAPLWPVVEKEDKLLLLRVSGSTEIAAPFLYTEQHSVCLKLNNEYGGLHVEVQLSEGGTYVTVRQYRDGHAPALLVNYTQHSITVYEKENVNVRKLPSMNQMLYTWENPAGPRILLFEGHKRKEIENDLRKDGIGDFMINETKRLWWVSFLDGLQRVILFTDDPILASGAHTFGEAEPINTEFVLAMHGLGLSLVNDPELTEILYVSISNSGIIWEQCKLGSRRYKKIEGLKAMQIEEAYQKYQAEKMVSDSGNEVSPRVKIDDKTEVDFDIMSIIRPHERMIRRTHSPGLWAVLGLTAHSRRLHARLYRLQVDQQLPLPTFPVMLAPVPPPKSVANDDPAGTKPFIEVSIVERMMEHSAVRQYKYYKLLVQEFHVKLDMGLVNALMGMFPQRVPTEQEALDAFRLDIEKARQPLEALAAMGAASDMKNFYDNLHLSPLKVHVSFSLGGATQLPTFVGTVLQSIGVTLTDMNDVVFKLSYYERNYEFLSQKELIAQVQSHYTGQALKQLYVLVLGLDVIGNPYGLVVGLKKGVEDLFYEPFQGAIQGPGEFAEGLMLGVRSLVGHTVGGAAGAVSRITGAMGHGLAALSLDKDYQRRRRDNINKPPTNLQEGLARSGKGLVMGVVDGVTGVFTKPFEGARDQGVEGFFKGLGVGAVGLVARPTAGVVDFASGSFDAVKRAADLSEEVTKRRAARYLAPDAGVRPYSRLQAEGYKMLFELEKGKFVSTDTYEAHVWVIPGKEVVMCTNKRLLYLEKNNVFGGWQIVWTYLWSEIPEVPTAVAKGVYIPTAKRKVLGMFPSSGSGKVIFLYDEQQKRFLLAQCGRLMRPR